MVETTALQDSVLYSSLAADPDLGDLVEMFVEELPHRIDRMRDCIDQGDWNGLQRSAHQLKGAAGSYGFPQLTPSLHRLEWLVRDASGVDEILMALDFVADLCGRVSAGTP